MDPAAEQELLASAQRMIAATEARLADLEAARPDAQPASDGSTSRLELTRSLLREARDAVGAGDVRGAANLAEKAHILAEDLAAELEP